MAKRIVVGVDGSETAHRAAATAGKVALASGAELHVVCAFTGLEVERIRQGSEELVLSREDDARRTATEAARRIQRAYQELTVRPRAAEGKPGDALVAVAEELDADLIVVGNKRVQGLGRVLGSIARDVAAQAPCDVYVAHTHAR
ncbi:universal stress protein [Nocardioides campestrisoli]|uniref:universal stress protein n=1 Tax=Nocardioides campestrisoli TaxID=2736757 RepID=UPI0015E6F088|nr:universal stress protein [Nocardioides campestrisoli]